MRFPFFVVTTLAVLFQCSHASILTHADLVRASFGDVFQLSPHEDVNTVWTVGDAEHVQASTFLSPEAFAAQLESSISGGSACASATATCNTLEITPCSWGNCYGASGSTCQNLSYSKRCGSSCTISGNPACGGGTVCVTSDCSTLSSGTCKAAMEYSCGCNCNRECLTGFCATGTCLNLRNAGEACLTSNVCASKTCGTGGFCTGGALGDDCSLRAAYSNPCDLGLYCNAALPSNKNEFPRNGKCAARIAQNADCTMVDHFNDGCSYGLVCDYGSGVGQTVYSNVLGKCRKYFAWGVTDTSIVCSTGANSFNACPLGTRCFDNKCQVADIVGTSCDNENFCAIGQMCTCAQGQKGCSGTVLPDLTTACKTKFNALMTCMQTVGITVPQFLTTVQSISSQNEAVNRLCKNEVIDLYCSCPSSAGLLFYSSNSKFDCPNKKYLDLSVNLCTACPLSPASDLIPSYMLFVWTAIIVACVEIAFSPSPNLFLF